MSSGGVVVSSLQAEAPATEYVPVMQSMHIQHGLGGGHVDLAGHTILKHPPLMSVLWSSAAVSRSHTHTGDTAKKKI
jgi:hypothetical protein